VNHRLASCVSSLVDASVAGGVAARGCHGLVPGSTHRQHRDRRPASDRSASRRSCAQPQRAGMPGTKGRFARRMSRRGSTPVRISGLQLYVRPTEFPASRKEFLMVRRRNRGWAIYSRDDAYKPGLLVPSAEMRTVYAVDVSWKRKIKTIGETAELARIAEQRVEKFVGIARREGATWEQIASVLGVTRQAAWSRYRTHPVAGGRRRDSQFLVNTLNFLRTWAVRSQEIKIRTTELVQEARKAGRSWESIALELGVRRQTAWERYNNPSGTVSSVSTNPIP